jgi:hypothetical protein
MLPMKPDDDSQAKSDTHFIFGVIAAILLAVLLVMALLAAAIVIRFGWNVLVGLS